MMIHNLNVFPIHTAIKHRAKRKALQNTGTINRFRLTTSTVFQRPLQQYNRQHN